jgi:hypothetical protein
MKAQKIVSYFDEEKNRVRCIYSNSDRQLHVTEKKQYEEDYQTTTIASYDIKNFDENSRYTLRKQLKECVENKECANSLATRLEIILESWERFEE